MDTVELYRLAVEYYNTAESLRLVVRSEQQLRELYTLLKLSLVCLNKILKLKGSINSQLRINCLLLKSEIIAEFNAEEYDENNELVRPEYLLDQAKLISSTHESLLNLRFESEFRLIRLNWQNKSYKFALRLISESIFAQTSIFKYLECLILIDIDPYKALQLLQFLISQQKIDNDKEIINLFMLMESNLALKLNSLSVVNLDLLQTDFQPLIIFKSLLDILYQLNLSQPIRQQDGKLIDILQIKMKSFAELISNNRNLPSSFQMSFNVFQRFVIPLEIKWLDYDTLFQVFLLIFAISNLNTSFEKRKSLQLLNKNLLTFEESFKHFNVYNTNLNSDHLKLLKEIKSQNYFYKIIEQSITVGFDENDTNFNDSIAQIEDNDQKLYILAIRSQSNNNLNEAKTHYFNLINSLRGQNKIYKDIFIISNINVLLIIESEIKFRNRIQTLNSELISILTNQRNMILSDLTLVENSLIKFKFLIKSTINFIHLLNNYENESTLSINENVSNLIDPLFEYFKNYPLFASMLLYLKSKTMNDNSDQKQKHSQLAFNLSKFGNQELIRYASGLLNQNNSQIAKNLQQFEIQSAKNEKIEKILIQKKPEFFQ